MTVSFAALVLSAALAAPDGGAPHNAAIGASPARTSHDGGAAPSGQAFPAHRAADGGFAPNASFDAFLAEAGPIADGFDAPVPRAGGPLLAIGHGVVESVGDGGVVVRHLFYENADRREVRVVAADVVGLLVQAGDTVRRGERLGARVRGAVTVEGALASAFVVGRGRLPVPQAEPVLVLVDTATNRARVYRRGAPEAEYEVGFGQGGVPKAERGDLRTPWGMYFVVQRHTGVFGGDYGAFYGGVWVKVNYPNAFDAARGLDAGLVTRGQAVEIDAAWRRRALTPQKTKLGGGIGFHGWAAEWEADAGTALSWGCVVLHLRDVKDFYARVPVGAMVVLLPGDGP